MEEDIVSLIDIYQRIGRVHVRMNPDYLKELLIKASGSDLPHKNKKFLNKIGMKINTQSNNCPTIGGWVRGTRTVPLEKLIKISKISKIPWKLIESNIVSINAGSMKNGAIYINFPIKINKNTGLIIGHILGDGSIEKKYNQVFYSNSNKELLVEFSNCMKKTFNIGPRIWMQQTSNFKGQTRWERRLNSIKELEIKKTGGLFYPSICGRILNGILDNFAIGTNKKITLKIMNSSEEFKSGLLRAFYDDEGTISKGSRNIRIFQDRNDMLEKIREILHEFGISSGEIKTYIKNEKERYYFDIHRKSNFIKFRDKIGFTSSKKVGRLNELCKIKNIKNSK